MSKNILGDHLKPDEISGEILKVILESRFFNEQELKPKITAIIKAFLSLSNDPARLEKPLANYERVKYLKSINTLNKEMNFWKSVVKDIVGKENMPLYYKQVDELVGKNSNG